MPVSAIRDYYKYHVSFMTRKEINRHTDPWRSIVTAKDKVRDPPAVNEDHYAHQETP